MSQKLILITGGGTIVPIDPVRSISNKSTGNFAASLVKAALEADFKVIYLVAQLGKSPFSFTINLTETDDDSARVELEKQLKFKMNYHSSYQEYRFNTYDDYATLLEELVKRYQPQSVITAAAVSDYIVSNYSQEKIRSTHDLVLQLAPVAKVINKIKTWLPTTVLVGFKMLVDATDSELIEASKTATIQHRADLVVANNLSSLERGKHEILIYQPNTSPIKIKENLAPRLLTLITQRLF